MKDSVEWYQENFYSKEYFTDNDFEAEVIFEFAEEEWFNIFFMSLDSIMLSYDSPKNNIVDARIFSGTTDI